MAVEDKKEIIRFKDDKLENIVIRLEECISQFELKMKKSPDRTALHNSQSQSGKIKKQEIVSKQQSINRVDEFFKK